MYKLLWVLTALICFPLKAQKLFLERQVYSYNDTLHVKITDTDKIVKILYIDLVSPFGEVIAQKSTSESTVSFPIMPMWESGFYELRVYKDQVSPNLATRVVPILAHADTDSIPIWNVNHMPKTIYPSWFDEFLSTNANALKGLLITKKGKPMNKAGLVITVNGYNDENTLVWQGTTLSGNHGEFSMEVPQDKMQYIAVTCCNKRGKELQCGFILIPNSKQGELSAQYPYEINKLLKELNLKGYAKNVSEREFYSYDMRFEALQAYFTKNRIPYIGNWFIQSPYFAQQMRKEKRTVGWNESSYSMIPSKKIQTGKRQYRVHTLNGDETIWSSKITNIFYALPIGGATPLFPPSYYKYEGAPKIRINKISSLIVLTNHDNAPLVPEDRAYLKPYDPIMVYFK